MAIVVALKSAIYLPDDWVMRKGEAGRHLFIIRIGVVAVIEEDTIVNKDTKKIETSIHIVATLEEGSFFGELALLLDSKRTVSVKAIGFCEMSTLSKEMFSRIMLDFPHLLEDTRAIAAHRRASLEDFWRNKKKKTPALKKWPTPDELSLLIQKLKVENSKTSPTILH